MKTVRTDASVTAFLASVESDKRRADCRAVMDIMKAATGDEAAMWGTNIVGFGEYRYRYASGREGDFFITGVAPRKRALTVYVMPGFADYGALMDQLGKFKTGSSCLYINKLEDVDLPTLTTLIEASVRDMRKKYPEA